MGRPLRHLEQADWFHVYNRGADRQDIFSLAGDHELFESLIGEACAASGVEVHAYALMTNHFHLLVFAPEETLSPFMQHLCGRYALTYNSRTRRTGPLFSGRYGSVPIGDDGHLLTEARYVERNPLAIVRPAALPAYRHASLGVLLGRRAAPPWLRTNVLLPMMTGTDYLRFVLDDQPSDLDCPIGLPSAVRPGIDSLLRSVSDQTGVDIAECGGPVRNVAVAVALELRIARPAELAGVFAISAAGIRMAARRGRVLVDTEEPMSRLKQRILDGVRSSVTSVPDPDVTGAVAEGWSRGR